MSLIKLAVERRKRTFYKKTPISKKKMFNDFLEHHLNMKDLQESVGRNKNYAKMSEEAKEKFVEDEFHKIRTNRKLKQYNKVPNWNKKTLIGIGLGAAALGTAIGVNEYKIKKRMKND